MPELPEVETVRRGLAPAMQGVAIAGVAVNRPGLRYPFPDRMADRLAGHTVLDLRRRSKYILADLSSGETLLVHLGMSGRLLVSAAGRDGAGRSDRALGQFHHDRAAPARHDHVVIHMANGDRIVFNDSRRFGMMDLIASSDVDAHPRLAGLGPEPFGDSFSEDYLRAALGRRNTFVKSALLDQGIVAGLGNIYACEALYRARISPGRRTGALSRQDVSRLFPAIRETLSDAIDAGGSSLRDFRRSDGRPGWFQHDFAVYGRANEPCRTDGCTDRIRRLDKGGSRSSFHCPSCQR